MSLVAIIPARGGSKRIPRKNVKSFLGEPIIAYSVKAALDSGIFDEVMVSTDDEEIAEIAQKFGAKVPFFRSPETSNDFATTALVLEEVLQQYGAVGKTFSYGCCLYPTAPLVKASSLKEGFELINSNGYDTVFPVLRFGYPVWRSLKVENGKAVMNWPEHLNSRSQDLTPAFHDAGQFYFFDVVKFKENKALFTANSGVIEVSELEAQDIDNLTDWKLAELKYKLLHQLD